VGKNVAYTGYSVLYGIARYSAELTVLQLVSKYMSQASVEGPGEEFVLRCQKSNQAIVFKCAWAGGYGKTQNYSMFLSLGYVFLLEHMIKEYSSSECIVSQLVV